MDDQDAVEVTCTDNGKKVTGYILNYRAKDQLEISLNTVKIRMQYKAGIFVGSMAGGVHPGAFDMVLSIQ